MQCFDVLWKREGIPYSIAIIQFAEHFAERKLFLWGKSLFELSPIAFDRSWWSWSPPSSNKYKRQSNLLIWHHPWPWPKPWQWSKSNCGVFMAIYGGVGKVLKNLFRRESSSSSPSDSVIYLILDSWRLMTVRKNHIRAKTLQICSKNPFWVI